MKKYTVEFTYEQTGETLTIDRFEKPEGYTATDYMEDCRKDSAPEWVEMLEGGKIEIRVIED